MRIRYFLSLYGQEQEVTRDQYVRAFNIYFRSRWYRNPTGHELQLAMVNFGLSLIRDEPVISGRGIKVN